MPDRTTTGIIIVIIVVRAQDGYYQTARYDDTKGRGYFAAAAILVHNSNDDIFWNMDNPLCLHNGPHETKNAFFWNVLLQLFHFKLQRRRKKEKEECQLI